MKLYTWIATAALLLSACAAPATQTRPAPDTQVPSPQSTLEPATVTPAILPASDDNLFRLSGIILPSPNCTATPTPAQAEGPYYKPGTPQRNSLLEPTMQGTRLLVVGYVLDQNCKPLPNTWIDFWQANANGEYDNDGYALRGHQYTDNQGRYFLETVVPGLYASRPIEHIHVKLKSPNGSELTSQLYFPQQPIDGLTVLLEKRDGYWVAYFNFFLAN